MKNITLLTLLILFSCNKKGEELTKTDLACCEKVNKANGIMATNCATGSGRAANIIGSETSSSLKKIENKLILIPEGTYMQGSNGDQWALDRELPQHKVKVNSFYMQV